MPLIPKQEPPYYENSNGITTKQYIALLTQSGTNAPTAIEIINTIGNITWTREDPGYYKGTLTNAFDANKTVIILGNTYGAGVDYAAGIDTEPDSIYLSTESTGGGADDLLDQSPIIITTYP